MAPGNEEMIKVLRLLEEKKITADEAARLIDALKDDKEPARHLRVRVFSEGKTEPRVRVDIPWSVVTTFVRFGGSLHSVLPQDFKINVRDKQVNIGELKVDELEKMVSELGAAGKLTIAEVWDEGKREKVEVYIE